MMKKLTLVAALAACAALAAVAPADQHNSKKKEAAAEPPQMYLVYIEHVQPAMHDQYEEATHELISTMQDYNIDPETVFFSTISGPEIGYVYVMPMSGFGEMETMHANWAEAIEKIGEERWQSLAAKTDACVESKEMIHVLRRADLSYEPEKPRLGEGDVQYIHYTFIYAMPGKEKQLEEVAKGFADLYREKEIDTGWSFYQSLTGSDLPMYVVATPAKSMADYTTHSEKIDEILGKKGEKLGQQAMACVRRVDLKDGWFRPDLCYPPVDVEAMESSSANPAKKSGTSKKKSKSVRK